MCVCCEELWIGCKVVPKKRKQKENDGGSIHNLETFKTQDYTVFWSDGTIARAISFIIFFKNC